MKEIIFVFFLVLPFFLAILYAYKTDPLASK